MVMKVTHRIEQQMYTRAERGIYRQSAGYDTVARSGGLDDAFVKDGIHPYCVYSPPRGLQPAGACDLDYPRAVTVVHYPCGRMLLGQAVHVPADFTGQRTAFFAHNYILPPECAGAALGDIWALLNGTKFEIFYDEASGGVLPLLGSLPCRGDEPGKFAVLGLELPHGQIDRIIQCVKESVSGAKKTYVIVPEGVQGMDAYVCGFLAEVYRRLPDIVKHLLGFCTYARQPENKKGLHLIFLEKGAVKANDSRMSRDFVIDLNENVHTISTPPVADKNADIYLMERISSLPPERFSREINFWHNRMPHLSGCPYFCQAEMNWLDNAIDNLTPRQLSAMPASFICKGKNGKHPSAYVILEILKNISASFAGRNMQGHVDIRYFLGSYSLSPADYKRVIMNLRRLCRPYVNLQNMDNIAFLFRARGSGELNEQELATYLKGGIP